MVARPPASLAALALLAAVALLAAGEAGAQQTRAWANDLAGELMSPYCPGRTLTECPSSQAQTLRMWLGVQEASGRSREEVEKELIARYGETILAAPRARGFGLAAYVLPVLAFVAGGAVLALFLRRQTRSGAPTGPALEVGPPDPELVRLVDEDLSR